jgi:putative membrane protein
MVADHGKANDELKALATSKGITLGTSLDARHQGMYDKLNSLSGADFDKTYISMMVIAHKKDDVLFSNEASAGTDLDLKAFAKKTDGIVKEHLAMVEQIQSHAK